MNNINNARTPYSAFGLHFVRSRCEQSKHIVSASSAQQVREYAEYHILQ